MPSHQVVEDWMGVQVVTLEDLFPKDCRAVLVGINPSPKSVAAGHYYQGRLGQRSVLPRLRQAGLVPDGHPGEEDDAAMKCGLGFTDIVKRPTASATEVRAAEYQFGRPILEAKLARIGAPLIIFSFKKAADKYFDKDVRGFGFIGPRLADSTVFVMPGPMASSADGSVQKALDDLREWK